MEFVLKLIAKTGLIQLAWVKHFDGSIYLKRIYGRPFCPGGIVYGIGSFFVGRVGILNPDGTIGGDSYMEQWKPYRGTDTSKQWT